MCIRDRDKTEAKVGDTLTYTITLTNNGNATGTVTVTDEILPVPIPFGTTDTAYREERHAYHQRQGFHIRQRPYTQIGRAHV